MYKMISLFTVLFCVGLFIYTTNLHLIVENAVVSRYRRFRQLNKLVQLRYKSILSILWVSCCMVAKMYWIQFLQWANNTIEYRPDGSVFISYVLNGKLYKVHTTVQKGPSKVLLITDELSNDVTDLVLPFLGPNRDWHNSEFTPAFWNKESLSFELSSGEQKSFTSETVSI